MAPVHVCEVFLDPANKKLGRLYKEIYGSFSCLFNNLILDYLFLVLMMYFIPFLFTLFNKQSIKYPVNESLFWDFEEEEKGK